MGDVIGVNGLFQALQADQLARTSKPRPQRAESGGEQPSTGTVDLADAVELSELGSLLSRLSDDPGIRLHRITRIRAELESGTYETPSKIGAAVDRLLEEFEP